MIRTTPEGLAAGVAAPELLACGAGESSAGCAASLPPAALRRVWPPIALHVDELLYTQLVRRTAFSPRGVLQLQRDVSPDDLLQVLLQEYLVKIDRFRLLAYRRFREQLGDYWILEHLELHRWEYLYKQAPLTRLQGSLRLSLIHI